MRSCHTVKSIKLIRDDRSYEAVRCIIKSDYDGLLEYLNLLHPKEREYLNSLKYSKRKYSYLQGRIASKIALKATDENLDVSTIEISRSVFNNPLIQYSNNNLQVSISHSSSVGYSMIFPEEHPLAIDIEAINESRLSSMEGINCKTEKQLFHNTGANIVELNTILWSAKEALSKILKTGLMVNLDIYEVSKIIDHKTYFESNFKNFFQYKVLSKVTHDMIISIALPLKSFIDNDIVFWEDLV